MEAPHFIAQRIKQQATFCEISPESTPVAFFGNIETSNVATLSLNPSHDEFYKKESLLLAPYKRLESLKSLNAKNLESLDEAQVRTVFQTCLDYFKEAVGYPYKRWFNPMDRLVQKSLGISYYNGTCCHTDIVQWATKPKWDLLKPETRDAMLSSDLPFLKELLVYYKINLVLMNGTTTVRHFKSLFANEISNPAQVRPNASGLKFFTGDVHIGQHSLKYFGWNKYIQRGLKEEESNVIATHLRDFAKSGLQSESTLNG